MLLLKQMLLYYKVVAHTVNCPISSSLHVFLGYYTTVFLPLDLVCVHTCSTEVAACISASLLAGCVVCSPGAESVGCIVGSSDDSLVDCVPSSSDCKLAERFAFTADDISSWVEWMMSEAFVDRPSSSTSPGTRRHPGGGEWGRLCYYIHTKHWTSLQKEESITILFHKTSTDVFTSFA